MAQQESLRGHALAAGPEIPDKLYFRIGEVARLCQVPAYVLRFWEGEFTQLKPNKGGTGQRLYRRRDVETARRIKSLLYDEGYTIAGARQVIKAETRQTAPQLALLAEDASGRGNQSPQLRKIRGELKDLHAMLSRAPAKSNVQAMRRSSKKTALEMLLHPNEGGLDHQVSEDGRVPAAVPTPRSRTLSLLIPKRPLETELFDREVLSPDSSN